MKNDSKKSNEIQNLEGTTIHNLNTENINTNNNLNGINLKSKQNILINIDEKKQNLEKNNIIYKSYNIYNREISNVYQNSNNNDNNISYSEDHRKSNEFKNNLDKNISIKNTKNNNLNVSDNKNNIFPEDSTKANVVPVKMVETELQIIENNENIKENDKSPDSEECVYCYEICIISLIVICYIILFFFCFLCIIVMIFSFVNGNPSDSFECCCECCDCCCDLKDVNKLEDCKCKCCKCCNYLKRILGCRFRCRFCYKCIKKVVR